MPCYIALLRGINISGKNKIPMSALKESAQRLGYTGVMTYLNSGNMRFTCDHTDPVTIAADLQEMIRERFALEIPVFVEKYEKVNALLESAPAWWGTEDKGIYDNLIFVLPPAAPAEIAAKIGETTEGLERIELRDQAIFWSFDRERYAKSKWWKQTAAAGIAERITIRTAGTIRKLMELK